MQYREIEILRLSSHPAIIDLIEVFEDHHYLFLILEYLQGGNLNEYLGKFDSKLTEAEAR